MNFKKWNKNCSVSDHFLITDHSWRIKLACHANCLFVHTRASRVVMQIRHALTLFLRAKVCCVAYSLKYYIETWRKQLIIIHIRNSPLRLQLHAIISLKTEKVWLLTTRIYNVKIFEIYYLIFEIFEMFMTKVFIINVFLYV